MTYQEKVARAEECFKLILNGSSLSEINDKLKNEGLFQYDITKVMSSIYQMLEDKYGYEIQKDIQIAPFANQNKYQLHDEVYQDLKNKQIQNFKASITHKISKLVATKRSDADIIAQLKSPLISESEIQEKIEKTKIRFQNQPKEKSQGNGIYSLIFGVLITVVFLIGNRISFLGIGLTIYGLYKMFFQAPDELNKTSELDEIGKE